MSNQQPYLSIITTARNDNYGGDLVKRMTCFINGIFHQAKKFKLPLELIIVEWNPPQDKPLLNKILPQPKDNDLVTLRYIVLPNDLHQKYRFHQEIPLYQMIAKNIGIRRANGKFILCTNIDLIFSDTCFQKIAEKKLKENNFYRANRFDISKEVININSTEKQLEFAKKNIQHKLGRIFNYKKTKNLKGMLFSIPFVLFFIDKIIELLKKTSKSKANLYVLDFNVCGDFTLMSKKDWLRIKGYCELDMYSSHIDSMALISAAAIGMNQKLFPQNACTYYIPKEDELAANDKTPEDHIRFLSRCPPLDWHAVYSTGEKLAKMGKPFELNNDNWGYSDIDLKEFIFAPQ